MTDSEEGRRIYFTNVILIGNVLGRSGFKMAGIDELFLNHGADPAWRIKAPISFHDSRYIDRVSGWLAGTNKFAPERTGPMIHAVLLELKQSGSTVSAQDRATVAAQIDRIERHLGLPSTSQPQLQLDPRVVAAAGTYWASRHYTRAVQNTFVALIKAVGVKAERPDLDGDALMRQAFSQDNPILRLSGVAAEQRGYMDLFAGSVLAIRNPLAHTPDEILTIEEASELLSFASFLFRTLDKAHKVT